MPNSQINPLLINQLLNQEISNKTDSPTTSSLPGTYVKAIFKNKKLLNPIIEKNEQMLICKSCGRKGKYDIGLLVVNIDKKIKTDNLTNQLQMTGYFRCKHCNAAGNWELPTSLHMLALTSVLPLGAGMRKRCIVGKNLLFDGSWHRYSTDAEDHLLHLLKEDPHNSYVWNRLGNMYQKGNRPELAASVFEHSILIDPGQAESHFTLGDMLTQISDLPNAGYHLRQMLLSAEKYQQLPAEKLREMLAVGLRLLFLMSQTTSGEVPFIPTLDEIKVSDLNVVSPNFAEMDLVISPVDVDSFFPLAEMYMGIRAKEIPIKKRTFNLMNTSNILLKQKKEMKKKRK